MYALDQLIPTPRLLEIDDVEIAAPADQVWQAVRHADLARTPLIRALFALRDLPQRWSGAEPADASIRIDALRSTPERPGFALLVDSPPHELAVGAIGKVWQPRIPFVHVADARAFGAFCEPGFIKVAWALQVEDIDRGRALLSLELRVDATDDAAWRAFRPYFALIGPASRFIRHSALQALARELERRGPRAALPGDELLPDAPVEMLHEMRMHATPEAIWPWLVQMGCRRAGFYSIDALDNAGAPSARELHPEWQKLEPGQFIDAAPDGSLRFQVLRVDEASALVLGALFDVEAQQQLAFDAPRPARYWQVTWAFALQRESARTTRVSVCARASFSRDGRFRMSWIRPVHHVMERAQLRNLRARVEGTLARDSASDVLEGLGGALRIGLELINPFQRAAHRRWGLSAEQAARTYPGDELVPEPRWSWSHGIEIRASTEQVWPWLAQIGAKHGGFYSYQWLENLAGCEIRNAERVHPEWCLKLGDDFFIHPHAPPLRVSALEPGRFFVVHAGPTPAERQNSQTWVDASWLFWLEPTGPDACRAVSRYRVAYSDDLATRFSFGPTFIEPIGFAMDRRMLIGLKQRAERAPSASTTLGAE